MLYVNSSFLHEVLHELKIILVYVFKSESRFRLQGSYLHITSLAITFSKPTVKLLRKKLVNIFLVFLLLIVIKYLSTENALQEFLTYLADAEDILSADWILTVWWIPAKLHSDICQDRGTNGQVLIWKLV